MTPSKSARWLIAVAAAMAHLGRSPAALSQAMSVALDYDGPAICPAEDDFWKALTTRTRRVQRGLPAHANVLLRVDLEASANGVLGRLEIVRDGFATEPRYVEAKDCADVLQALALTAALGIDPGALTRRNEAGTEPDSGGGLSSSAAWTTPDSTDGTLADSTASESSSSAAPDSAVSNSTTPESPVFDSSLPESTLQPTPWSRPSEWEGALGVQLIGAQPVDLRGSWGVAASVAAHDASGGVWSPALRIGVALLRSDIGSDDGPARFGLLTVFAHVCALNANAPRLQLRPCLATQFGVLEADAIGVSAPETSRRIWTTGGLAVELQYRISESFSAQLDLAAHLPLTPQRYTLGLAADEIAKTPTIMPWLAFGINYAL